MVLIDDITTTLNLQLSNRGRTTPNRGPTVISSFKMVEVVARRISRRVPVR